MISSDYWRKMWSKNKPRGFACIAKIDGVFSLARSSGKVANCLDIRPRKFRKGKCIPKE